MSTESFFESWGGLARVLTVGIIVYFALILILRISGKRTLSKLNAFDLVVTVALGSTLATIIMSKDVALVEGVLALLLLIGLQYAVSWSSLRSEKISQLVKSDPTLLFYRGQYVQSAMRSSRVVEAEIRAVVRQQGVASMEHVEAVVLETDGTMSVVELDGTGSSTSLQPLSGFPDR